MTVELNENMTSDEVQAAAASIIEEVEQERQAEQKSDAEIVVSTSAASETPVEKKSDSDTAEAESQGETAGDLPDAPEWVTDEVKAEITAYGIDESDLSDFASREDLERVLRLLDKTAIQSGRKALAEEADKKPRGEDGKFVKKEEHETDESNEEPQKTGRYEVSLNKDLYDEEIIDEFSRMRDHYEARLESMESRFTEVNAMAEEQKFDGYVDSLGHTDLFGKTGSESDKELERRRDLNVAVKAQLIGLERLGRPTELTDQVVARVANMVFAEELNKKRLKQQTNKISKQSQLRLGGSPTKPLSPRDDPREEADRLYKELERS